MDKKKEKNQNDLKKEDTKIVSSDDDSTIDTSGIDINPGTEVIRLSNEVVKLKEEIKKWQYVAAEQKNKMDKMEREIGVAKLYSISQFAKDITETLENLYRTVSYIKDQSHADTDFAKIVIEGIDMTILGFTKTLEKNGIKRIEPKKGDSFNVQEHTIIAYEEIENDEEIKNNTVIKVFESGYMINDRLLKPASVLVAKKKS